MRLWLVGNVEYFIIKGASNFSFLRLAEILVALATKSVRARNMIRHSIDSIVFAIAISAEEDVVHYNLF